MGLAVFDPLMLTVTAAYLLLLLVVQWDLSWIIWPVAGVLFAAVYGIVRALRVEKRDGT